MPSIPTDFDVAPTSSGSKRGSKRGRKRLMISLEPKPISQDWVDPNSFHEALSLHMKRHQESCIALQRVLAQPDIKINSATIKVWASGLKLPRNIKIPCKAGNDWS